MFGRSGSGPIMSGIPARVGPSSGESCGPGGSPNVLVTVVDGVLELAAGGLQRIDTIVVGMLVLPLGGRLGRGGQAGRRLIRGRFTLRVACACLASASAASATDWA